MPHWSCCAKDLHLNEPACPSIDHIVLSIVGPMDGGWVDAALAPPPCTELRSSRGGNLCRQPSDHKSPSYLLGIVAFILLYLDHLVACCIASVLMFSIGRLSVWLCLPYLERLFRPRLCVFITWCGQQRLCPKMLTVEAAHAQARSEPP